MEPAVANGGQRRTPCRLCLSPCRVTGTGYEPSAPLGHLGVLLPALLLALWLGKHTRGVPVMFLSFTALQRRGNLAYRWGGTFFGTVVGRNGLRGRRFFFPGFGRL